MITYKHTIFSLCMIALTLASCQTDDIHALGETCSNLDTILEQGKEICTLRNIAECYQNHDITHDSLKQEDFTAAFNTHRCPTGFVCSEDKHICAMKTTTECSPKGEIKCENGLRIECQPNDTGRLDWINTNQICCTDGEKKCDIDKNDPSDSSHPNSIYQCINKEWQLILNCIELGSSCVIVNNIATCGACINGEERFYNSPTNICLHMTCNDAKWILDEDYCGLKEVSCNLNLTECGECLNNDIRCENNVIYQCIGGSWIQNNKCDFSCSEIIDENQKIQYVCGECITGESKHWNNPDNGICVFSKCENGKWIDDYNECPNGSCLLDDEGNYLGCGECINDSSRCSDKLYQVCKNGKFADILACDSCNDNICVRSCITPNKCTQETDTVATFCNSDGQIEFCPAGCSSDNICMNCQDGEQIFKEEDDVCFYRTCENNLYPEAYTKCTDINNKGVSCIKGNNDQVSCGECKNGSKKCEQKDSSCTCQICQNGQWTKLCTNNYSCKGTSDNYSNCGECTNSNSEFYYQEGTTCYHRNCSNGTWSPVQKCNSDNSCIGTPGKYTDCGECINGKKYNVIETSGICNYNACSAGKLGAMQTCPNMVSCNKARTDCGVCQNKKTKCEQGYLFTCTDGAWPTTGTYCPKGCNSNGEKCKS